MTGSPSSPVVDLWISKKFSSITSADLNNDGNLDLFTTSLDNFGVGIRHGNGHYGWKADTQNRNPARPGRHWQQIRTSITNGNPDIVVVGSYSGSGGAGDRNQDLGWQALSNPKHLRLTGSTNLSSTGKLR